MSEKGHYYWNSGTINRNIVDFQTFEIQLIVYGRYSVYVMSNENGRNPVLAHQKTKTALDLVLTGSRSSY